MVAKTAFLFPGQGSQYPGMGKFFYERFSEVREMFEQANEVLGVDIGSKILNGNDDELRKTSVTQPAIYIVSCAIHKTFSKLLPPSSSGCSFVAGHSLGEYVALYSSKVFDFQTGLKLVEYRAKFIQECCEKAPGTMAAIIGMEKNELQKLCQEINQGGMTCEMVNFNSPGQIVVAGTKTAVETLLQKIVQKPGTKGIPLNVSGAFHSTLMKDAADRMAQVLQSAALRDAEIPVVTNCDAQITTRAEAIKVNLAKQIDHPVLWVDSISKMIGEGVETFIELGPGKVLSALLRKIDRNKKSLNIEDEGSLQKTMNEWPGTFKAEVKN